MAKKTSDIELKERVRYVRELIFNDFNTQDIIRAVVNKWGITDRQAYRYLDSANLEFAEKDKLSFDRKKAYYKARKLRLIRDMDPAEKKTSAGITAINNNIAFISCI